MSDWSVIVPEVTTNYVLNPSGEIAGNFAAVGGTVTRVTAQSFYGLYSYRIQTAADNQGATFTLGTLTNAIHYVTMRVRGTLPASWDWSLDGAAWHVPTLIKAIDANWNLYGYQFSAAEAVGSVLLSVYQNGAGVGDFYIDGIQVEQQTYWTTYVDGERDGCEWAAVPHASTSSRSAQSRAGGRIRDLETVYGLNISGMSDFGVAPTTLTVDEYAILPGGEMESAKIHPRSFILSGTLVGTSTANLHSLRQTLIALFDPEAYPGEQPIRFRYTGAAQEREIAAYYQSGLEATVRAEDPCWWEKVAIRFIADEPFWYEVGETSWVLDHNDPNIFYYTAGRLRSTGQWDDLAITANPAGGGTIYTMCWGPDHKLYIGGDFTGWNGLGAGNMDYIACWDPLARTWSIVGTAGNDITDIVRVIKFDSAGLMHVGGDFTNVGGGATDLDYIVTWDGAAWGNLGSPGEAAGREVQDMAWDSNGDLYIVGVFEDWAGVGNADYIAVWDGTAWGAVGIPKPGAEVINRVYAIAIDSTDLIYVGGDFADWAAIGNAHEIAVWNGTTWAALGTLMLNSSVRALAIRESDDVLFLGGGFTTFGGNTLRRIALWNGYNFEPLGSGLNSIVHGLKFGPDGNLLIVGEFHQTGDTTITFAEGLCMWNGITFEYPDVNLPGTGGDAYYAVETGSEDPIIQQNYDIFVGFSQTGNGTMAGTTPVTNSGTELMFPTIKIGESGDTTTKIISVRNETIGRKLLSDYLLLDGETLTIDLEPTEKNVVSSYFGTRLDAVLACSDFGSLALQIGSNQITCFIDEPDGKGYTEYNDNNNQLSGWNLLTGITHDNIDALDNLYVRIFDGGGGFLYVYLYDDPGRAIGDLVGHTFPYNGVGNQAITEDNGSGLGGFITIDAVVGIDDDIYVHWDFVKAWMVGRTMYAGQD